MFIRRLAAALTSTALLVTGLSVAAPPASAASSSGVWSGTVSMTSMGTFDYRVGYRGEGTTRSQATSSHQLGWTLRFDDVVGDPNLASAAGSATLLDYGWSGSATSSSSSCGYAAAGSMDVTNVSGYAFTGLTPEGAPGVSGYSDEALSLSRPAECNSDVIFGFSGPNAGTLAEDQWWDAYLLNPSPPEPTQQPQFSLCWHPEVLTGIPAGEDQPDGTRRIVGTSTGSCDGTKVEWFGDSDVSHVMDVDVAYSYDLTFVPTDECETNQMPSAAIFAKPVDWREGKAASGAGVTMAFEGIGTDPDGGPVTFSWLFHDASGTVTKTGKSVLHRWSTAGATRDRKIAVTVADECGAKAATGLGVWVSGDPDVDFAPVMRLHPNDKFWPMSAGRFVARSSLFFKDTLRRVKISGDPSAARLGNGGYSWRTGVDEVLGRGRKSVKTDDLTRPYDDANATLKRQGFYLDLADGARVGTAPVGGRITAPMYLQKAGNKRVYWQFYGYSKPTLRDGSGVPRMAHEGDWERVIVELNEYRVPSQVGFVAHHEPVGYVAYRGVYAPAPRATADVLTTTGLAPVGYVSRLGHGTWPDAGRDCFSGVVCDYRSNNGPTWTGRHDLRSITSQAWFGNRRDHRTCRSGSPMPADRLACGFGGGWGRAGGLPDTSGPLGPSAYKDATKN